MFVNFYAINTVMIADFQAQLCLRKKRTEGTVEPWPASTPTPAVSYPQAGSVSASSLGPRTVAQQRPSVASDVQGRLILNPDAGHGEARPTHQAEGVHAELHPSFKVPVVLPLQYCEDCTRLSSPLWREVKPALATAGGGVPFQLGPSGPTSY